MAEKIYEDTQANKTIVANDVKTLNDVIWKEIATTNGRGNVEIFSSNRAKYLIKRKTEIEKGYLTEEEFNWFIKKYFKTLPNWHSLYLMQGSKYEITSYTAYIEYLTAYQKLQSLYSQLKAIKKGEDGKYNIETLKTTWTLTWQEYYEKCDNLDSVIIAKIKETSILKAITEYSINESNDVPPSWRTEESDENWTTEKPQNLDTYQSLWARTKYFYLDNTTTRNKPYLVVKATTKKGEEGGGEETPSSAITLYLSSTNATWTARGLKVEKTITLTCIYEDMLLVKFEVLQGSGVTIEDTEEDNVKNITTPIYQSDMTEQVIIRAYVLDTSSKVVAEATATLNKTIVGSAEAVYLGCKETTPTSYSHDSIEDNLIKGDFYLHKGKTGTDPSTDFMFGIVYELVDPNSFTLRSAWEICTDTDKIAQTITDSIAIGAYSQENGTFNNLIVNTDSTFNGSFKVNVEESKFKHILPQEDSTYNIGSSDLKWLYAYINNIISTNGTFTTLNPTDSTSSTIGSSSLRWNTIYGNIINGSHYNKNGNALTYQLYADQGTTMAVQNNGSTYSGSSNTTTIYWSVFIFTDNNNYRYALCSGNGLRSSMNICDITARVYLPISYIQTSENYGYGYNAWAEVGLNSQTTSGSINRIGSLAIVRGGSSTFRGSNYFTVNGDCLSNNGEVYSFHFLVWGRY